MTSKDYATIQRLLGFIEGLIANDTDTIIYDGITAAVNGIDAILNEYMNNRTEVNPMKKYEITAYIDGVKYSKIVEAKSSEEAKKLGWEMFDTDSIYVEEVAKK
jgi:hypothetical protein